MVKVDYSDNDVITKLREKSFDEVSYFNLQYLANTLLLKGKKEKLMIQDEIREKISLFEHQINAALRYINSMDGRVILADEVGLGKTVEAGIIMKELIAREDIKKILILTPASLSLQWQAELADKFLLNFEYNKSVHKWTKHKKIISSIDLAKMDKHINEISSVDWDLLIVDEAHRLKNPRTKTYKAFQKIKARHKLFLTATPLQNNIMELFYCIDLLDEGYMGTAHEFKQNYVADKSGLEIFNKEKLNEILSGIMIRTTRKEAGLEFTKRKVKTILTNQTSKELEFQDLALGFISQQHEKVVNNKKLKGVGTLQLMTLSRMLTSCRYSFASSFKKYLRNNCDSLEKESGEKLLKLNEELPENKKMTEIIKLVDKIKDKVVIFTQFRNTQDQILDLLEKQGLKCSIIRGGMTAEEKKTSVLKFKRGDSQILVSTESGSEGLNLQFCHHLINYDLPWNPMRVEQRIGRIHRIGQEHDVHIYNIVIKGTVEEYILDKLFKKLDLFRLAIGKMADIVENVLEEDSFDKNIFDILVSSKNKVNWKKKLDTMFAKLSESKDYQEKVNQLDNETLKSFDLSPIKK